MDKWGEYAPYICVAIAFLTSYKIFVTPSELETKLDQKLEKYVLKETYNVAVNEIKSDIAEMKNKLDRIYEKLINA